MSFAKKILCPLLFLSAIAQAEPPKKGRVMCEGSACSSHDIPTGSVIERAGEFAEDFTSRVKRRIEIANEPRQKPTVQKAQLEKGRVRVVRNTPARPAPPSILTNLPAYFQGVDRSEVEANEKVVFVPKSSTQRLKGLASGDVVWVVVEQEIVASPSVPTPVRATAIGGPLKGSIFLGEATLDRELKRVCMSFTRLRLKDRDAVYALKASALSPRGSVCLDGDYVSQAGKFFVAELASAAAAGFVDSTVGRNQTALGTYVQEPTFANSGKTAAVTALSKTTERLAESARNAPEYTQLKGYQEIQLIIQDEPSEPGT